MVRTIQKGLLPERLQSKSGRRHRIGPNGEKWWWLFWVRKRDCGAVKKLVSRYSEVQRGFCERSRRYRVNIFTGCMDRDTCPYQSGRSAGYLAPVAHNSSVRLSLKGSAPCASLRAWFGGDEWKLVTTARFYSTTCRAGVRLRLGLEQKWGSWAR
jgi:hypothetical protein